MRQYLLLALTIYIVTLVLSCLIYAVLVLVEKRLPLVTEYAFSIGEVIVDTVHLLSRPLRCVLPNLTEDEYYLMLINAIITAFAFVYAYLFCKFARRMDMFVVAWICLSCRYDPS